MNRFNRLVVALLLGAAVLLLAAPGLVGWLAERQLGQPQLPLAAPEVHTLSFERRWFGSEGRHRLLLDRSDQDDLRTLVALAAGVPPADAAALVFDTRLRHGLVSAANPQPAIAHGDTSLLVETVAGAERPLPGRIKSRLAIDGTLHLDYRAQALSGRSGQLQVAADDVQLATAIGIDGRLVAASAVMRNFRHGNFLGETTVGRFEWRAAGRAGPAGLPLGETTLTLADWRDGSGVVPGRIHELSAALRSSERGGTLQLEFDLDADGIEGPDGAYGSNARLRATRLDPVALAALVRALQGAGDPGTAAQALLAGGAALFIDGAVVVTPDGPLTAAVELSVTGDGDRRDWPGLLLRSEGRAIIELPVARANPALPGGDVARQLLAAGVLKPGPSGYRAEVSLQRGRLIVNGVPYTVDQLERLAGGGDSPSSSSSAR